MSSTKYVPKPVKISIQSSILSFFQFDKQEIIFFAHKIMYLVFAKKNDTLLRRYVVY